MLIKNLDQK